MNWWVLKRRIHISWLIAIVAVGCVIGVALAWYMPQGWFGHGVWLVLGLVMMVIGWRYRYWAIIPLCLVGGVIVGLWRGAIDQADLTAYGQIMGKVVEIEGVVQEDVDSGANGMTVMKLGSVKYAGADLPGVIWVNYRSSTVIQRSDTVVVQAKLSEGFGNFPGAMYRAEIVRVMRPEPGDIALRTRDRFGGLVRSVVPEPEVSLGLGYLLGQRRSLPEDLSEALRIAGLTHVIVASGYNLTILVRFARRIFAKVSRFVGLVASSGLVLSFIAITGMSPSMSRAGLVTGLSLLAWYYGRQFHPLVLLPVAAAVTVLVNPSYAWGDVGWQLSFAAFAGVMIVSPLLQAYFFGDKPPGTVRQIMGETVAAQLTTLPIIILTFGQVSNVALIANALILPFVPLAMLLVFLTGIGVAVAPPIGALIALPTTWMLHAMTSIARYVADLPWAVMVVEVGPVVLLAYGVIIAACFYMQRVTKLQLRAHNVVD